MTREDLPGYMLDEVAKQVVDMGFKTEEELHEYLVSEGGQHFEELGYELMAMYLRSKDNE